MDILTPEQLEQKKDENRKSEIRQNVKSHCTKIRDGINKNGSTSGNRAIWELFQNAGDLVEGSGAEIKITLTNEAFVFAHKGKPFTYDTLCSLVKQVSSEEKENDEKVGQYGTGFLTTHKFSRVITVNGSMLISKNPTAYVDVDDFVINRDNFDRIPIFIEDMADQISKVEKLMDAEQKSEPKVWTELSYELNDERRAVAQTAIDEALKLMPYVLTFNDNINSCLIIDHTRTRTVSYSKTDKECTTEGLQCKRIMISENDGEPQPFDCYYLELHEKNSRIILPLKNETTVYSLKNIPTLFVHFPLIGPRYFGVNFLFHSHLFIPKESRDNIIVPRDNDATDKSASHNKTILEEMTKQLWTFLEANVHNWSNTIKMASIKIKDSGYGDDKTDAYYQKLKEQWVTEFSKLKLIEINGNHYSLNEDNHPVVLEPQLESFISEEDNNNYLPILYSYASKIRLIPCKDELLDWSKIIAEWDATKRDNFLSLDVIVNDVSQHQGDYLYDMLKMIVKAGYLEFFDKYPLLPNREGDLKKRGELRNAESITKELYGLVKNVDETICIKMVDEKFAEIIELTPYTRQQLREELNSTVKKKEEEYWKLQKKPYDKYFEKNLIALCSTFQTENGESKRNKLMPIICRFEGIEYEEKIIPACVDDAPGFDLYRQIFLSLAENQMMKIDQYDEVWVQNNISDLVMFVDNARGDDYKGFCTRYAIYPDMNGRLHLPDELRKNNEVDDMLFDLYNQVLGEDLKGKCVDKRFELFFEKYAEGTHQFTSEFVAGEIQNKLSNDKYQDTVLLDIIDLTERDGEEGLKWRLLFKDIYGQRETIRYNLGTDIERKAINVMLKQKNPELLKKMAEVSKRKDALMVLSSIIDQKEHDEYIKMLGAYVEEHLQKYLTESLKNIGVTVSNEQCGQDLVLRKSGYEDYYIEIKSRWESDQSIEMSVSQFECAVNNPNNYALISVNMYQFDRTRAENNDPMLLSEIYSNIKVLDNIGSLEADLYSRTKEAFKGSSTDIRLDGSYTVRVPQDVFKANPLDYNGLINRLQEKFDSKEP